MIYKIKEGELLNLNSITTIAKIESLKIGFIVDIATSLIKEFATQAERDTEFEKLEEVLSF